LIGETVERLDKFALGESFSSSVAITNNHLP
jgi:hypothetical protein